MSNVVRLIEFSEVPEIGALTIHSLRERARWGSESGRLQQRGRRVSDSVVPGRQCGTRVNGQLDAQRIHALDLRGKPQCVGRDIREFGPYDISAITEKRGNLDRTDPPFGTSPKQTGDSLSRL